MIPLYDWPDHGRAGSNPRVMDDRREWSETQMKRILLLATGGTIASRAGQDGLEPQPAPPELLHPVNTAAIHPAANKPVINFLMITSLTFLNFNNK